LLTIIGLTSILILSKKGEQRKHAIGLISFLLFLSTIGVFFTEQGYFLYQRLIGEEGVTGDAERQELTQSGIAAVKEYWLFGSYHEGRLFHNLYLTYFGVLGIVGLAALIIFFSQSWISIFRKIKIPEAKVAISVFGAMLIVLTVHNAVAEPVIWFIALSPYLISKDQSLSI